MRLFLFLCLLVFNLYSAGIQGQKAPNFGVDIWLQNQAQLLGY